MDSELWINFRQMLSKEDQNEIGLSEDRNIHQCITRLAGAYTDLKEKVEKGTYRHAVYYFKASLADEGLKVRAESFHWKLEGAKAARLTFCKKDFPFTNWDEYDEWEPTWLYGSWIIEADILEIEE